MVASRFNLHKYFTIIHFVTPAFYKNYGNLSLSVGYGWKDFLIRKHYFDWLDLTHCSYSEQQKHTLARRSRTTTHYQVVKRRRWVLNIVAIFTQYERFRMYNSIIFKTFVLTRTFLVCTRKPSFFMSKLIGPVKSSRRLLCKNIWRFGLN